MRTVTKSFSVSPGTAAVKFRDGGEDLSFTAVVSRFGNIDSQGEIVESGAFSKSLSRQTEVPCVWSHEWSDPFNYIGVAKCSETEDGLYVEATLDGSNPTARQVHRLMQLGVIKEFSFSAGVEDGYIDTDGVVHLTELDLFEVGPCLVGANRETSLESVSASRTGDVEKGVAVAEETTDTTAVDDGEDTAATETAADTTEETAPVQGIADLAQAILAAVQATVAASPSGESDGATEEPEETSVPVPSEEPVTEEKEPSETEETQGADVTLAHELLAAVTDGLDHGESAVTILQGLVDSLDSRVSGGKEDN